MTGKQDRTPVGGERFEQLAHLGDAVLVEAIHRLVEDHQGRLLHDCLRNAEALPHTERILADGLTAHRVEPHAADRVGDLLQIDLALQRREDLEVFEPRKLWQKARRFDDQPDVLGKVDVLADLLAVHEHLAAGRLQKAADALEHDRLTGAVVSDDAVDPSRLKVAVDALQNRVLSEHLYEIVYFNCVCHGI